MIQVTDAVPLLQQLIAIDSTPPVNAGRRTGGGERLVAEFLRDLLRGWRYHVVLDEVAPGRPNLIAMPATRRSDRPLVVLETHMDTVAVTGMTIAPFAGEIRDGRIYGRGACDTKGTMAAMLAALSRARTNQQEPQIDVGFVATMDEESGGVGARHLCENGFAPQFVVVAEPTNLQPVVAHKGLWRFALATRGRACHSSRPHEGENAIERMWQVQADLHRTFTPFWAQLAAAGENSLSINTIRGGSFINVVPDFCRIEVDCRYAPGTDLDVAAAALERFCGSQADLTCETIVRLPAFATPDNSLLLPALEKALRKHGLPARRRREPWFADAAFFAQAGADTVIWGAGDIAQAHTADEFIEISQLQMATEVLATLIADFATGDF